MGQDTCFFAIPQFNTHHSMSLTSLPAYQALAQHYADHKDDTILSHFTSDPTRFSKFSLSFVALETEILLDYSKNRVSPQTMKLLFDLMREVGLESEREKMFSGDRINFTEYFKSNNVLGIDLFFTSRCVIDQILRFWLMVKTLWKT